MFKIKNLFWLFSTFLVIILDQFTKHLAVSHLVFYQPVQICRFLNFTLAYNYGVAFSLFNQGTFLQHWSLIILTSLISIWIFIWLMRLREQEKLKFLALSFILGGAIGNLINRISLGYVIDFIDFYIMHYHWPTFNVADSFVCIGVFLLFLVSIKKA